MLSRTSITGSLLVDGMIRFANNLIETIGETLYIQKNKLANLDLLDGTVLIDTFNRIFFRGNVAVNGNQTVNGVLGASTIAALTGGRITIDLNNQVPDLTATASASPSSTFTDLVIRGINNSIVARVDASGSATFSGSLAAQSLITSGSATVAKLNINTNVAATSGSAVPAASAGTGSLPAQFTEVTILSSQVATNSLIYLTPLTSTGNKVLYVKQKLPGTGFIVAIDNKNNAPIDFSWWVIN